MPDVEGVKLHPLHVIAGTRLEEWHRAGKYRPLEMGEYGDLGCRFLELLHPDTVIQRITADCRAGLLVAPAWLNDRQTVLAAVDRTLEERDTRQGRLFGTDLGTADRER